MPTIHDPDLLDALEELIEPWSGLTSEGAEAELAKVIERQSRPVRRPLNTYRFDVALSRAADLTGDALADVGVSTDALISERWDSPSRVGAAAAWLGITGLLVPSARHEAANLVVFVHKLRPVDVLEIG